MRWFVLLPLLFSQITWADNQFITAKKPTYCPDPHLLQKDPKTLTWRGPHRWQSFNPSFANKLTGLKRAQWQGINLGTVICIYESDNDSAFPVFLQAPGSYRKPSGGSWQRQKDFYACLSEDKLNCPFYRVHQHKDRVNSDQDIIRLLDDIRKAPKPLPTK